MEFLGLEVKKVKDHVGERDFVVLAPSSLGDERDGTVDHWKKLITNFTTKFPEVSIVITGA